jgi:hypothetical protein
MGVKLGIKFATGVMMIDGNYEVPGCPIRIGPPLPQTGCGVGFQFPKNRIDRLLMRFDKPLVITQVGHYRN